MSLPCRAHRRPQRGKSMKGNKPFRTKMTTVPFLFRSGTVFLLPPFTQSRMPADNPKDTIPHNQEKHSTQPKDTPYTAERQPRYTTARQQSPTTATALSRQRQTGTRKRWHFTMQKITFHHAKDDPPQGERSPSVKHLHTSAAYTLTAPAIKPHGKTFYISWQNHTSDKTMFLISYGKAA